MRILVTNDDGIDARGLTIMQDIAATVSSEVWVVAPKDEQSGQSRAISLGSPVRTRQLDERCYAVSGTPGDCIMVALREIMQDTMPDLVLSGVNSGQNLADDTGQSGTIGAAIIAMQLGVPAIAMSQVYDYGQDNIPWPTALWCGQKILPALLEKGWPEDSVLSINFPDRPPEEITGVQTTIQGMRKRMALISERRLDIRGKPYTWIGFSRAPAELIDGTDLYAIHEGRVSVTPLHVDMTNINAFKGMNKIWSAIF